MLCCTARTTHHQRARESYAYLGRLSSPPSPYLPHAVPYLGKVHRDQDDRQLQQRTLQTTRWQLKHQQWLQPRPRLRKSESSSAPAARTSSCRKTLARSSCRQVRKAIIFWQCACPGYDYEWCSCLAWRAWLALALEAATDN